jgi:hypothetical protein
LRAHSFACAADCDDASLPRGRLINGRVSDAATGQAIPPLPFDATGFSSRSMAFYTDISNYAGFGQVDFGGRYLSRTGFPPGPVFAGTFLLRNKQSYGFGYTDQLYNGLACPWLACGVTTGSALTIAAVDLTGINFALNKGGVIRGAISRSSDAAPIEAVLIEAFNGAGKKVGQASADPNGGYSIYGLPTGSYFVTTSNVLGLQDQLYGGTACTGIATSCWVRRLSSARQASRKTSISRWLPRPIFSRMVSSKYERV